MANVQFRMTTEEALKWARKAPAGTSFYLAVGIDCLAPTLNPDHFIGEPGMSSVPLSRKQALIFLEDFLSERQRGAGYRIPCSEYTSERDHAGAYLSYWIGV